MNINNFDVKALRAFRVLRPLRLVSGVPSKYLGVCVFDVLSLFSTCSIGTDHRDQKRTISPQTDQDPSSEYKCQN